MSYGPYVSRLKIGDKNYDVKDNEARELISSINSFEYTLSTSAEDTPISIEWKNASGETIIGTLVATEATQYKIYLVYYPTLDSQDVYREYITLKKSDDTYVWELLGTTQPSSVYNIPCSYSEPTSPSTGDYWFKIESES